MMNIHYVRRRGRISARLCNQHGLWSARWFARAARWDAHLDRDRSLQGWAPKLRRFRDREWFVMRWMQLAPSDGWSASIHAGRTDTRAFLGRVNMRWHDGVQYALACNTKL